MSCQTGVVQADAVFEPFAYLRAIGTCKLEAFECVPQRSFFLARADIEAGEILRALSGLKLRKVDDIDRSLGLGDEIFERGGERELRIGKFQRNWTLF